MANSFMKKTLLSAAFVGFTFANASNSLGLQENADSPIVNVKNVHRVSDASKVEQTVLDFSTNAAKSKSAADILRYFLLEDAVGDLNKDDFSYIGLEIIAAYVREHGQDFNVKFTKIFNDKDFVYKVYREQASGTTNNGIKLDRLSTMRGALEMVIESYNVMLPVVLAKAGLNESESSEQLRADAQYLLSFTAPIIAKQAHRAYKNINSFSQAKKSFSKSKYAPWNWFCGGFSCVDPDKHQMTPTSTVATINLDDALPVDNTNDYFESDASPANETKEFFISDEISSDFTPLDISEPPYTLKRSKSESNLKGKDKTSMNTDTQSLPGDLIRGFNPATLSYSADSVVLQLGDDDDTTELMRTQTERPRKSVEFSV